MSGRARARARASAPLLPVNTAPSKVMKSDLFTSSLRPVDFRDRKEKSFTGIGGEAEPRILKDGSTTGDLLF